MSTHASSATKKKRIAILGGGAAAMAAAWRITSEPDWQQRYEVTLYQMGWRLGGKGASGRRPPHGRIEEHGLHIWLGFYHNAFRALQAAHAVINPGVDESVPAGCSPPRILNGVFARCEDAFEPQSYVGLDTDLGDTWAPWMMKLPVSGSKPWQGGSMPSLKEYLHMLVQFVSGKAFVDDNRPLYERDKSRPPVHEPSPSEIWKGLFPNRDDGAWLTALAWELGLHISSLSDDPAGQGGSHPGLQQLLVKLQGAISGHFDELTRKNAHAGHFLLMLDTATAVLRGVLHERAFEGDNFKLLDQEFRTWLRQYGALPTTCRLETNPILRGLYDFVFAFEGGDATAMDATANFETAPALRTIFRMCFTYDGSIFWKMRAGMGDTIFTPFYKALKQRGVEFKFFHRVKQLHLNADKSAIASIEIAQQVKPLADYDPLVRWVDLDCWPSEPNYSQLERGEELRAAVAAQDVDLESMWFKWKDSAPLTLNWGTDFDQVVFAIPLGSVPFVAQELVDANKRWRTMVNRVKTVRTMSLQLWLKPDLRGLGWLNEAPVIDSYMEPFDTWADMSHLLPREDWSHAAEVPRSVAYFCGAMEGDSVDTADPRLPLHARAQVFVAAEDRVLAHAGNLWPDAALADGSLDPALVLDRYQRANIEPSERYVMSVAGSSVHRIKANETDFSNLKIAGDWIDNGFNAGCVEAAVMSGLQAANAVLGKDLNADIYGRQLC